MEAIGGYIELELNKGTHHYHDTPYAMKSGRSSLYFILSIVKPAMVYMPYFTCNATIEPFELANIPYQFYEINEQLEPKTNIDLKPGEYFLYINYLDLKRETVRRLSDKYKDKLIVDCAQAFFMKGNNVSWFFNSCRKFFGVPDGSYLYVPTGVEIPVVGNENEDYTIDHLLKRFNGNPSEGYNDFLRNEILCDSTIARMSKLSEYILSGIDYDEVIARRKTNYEYMHAQFGKSNLLDATASDNSPIFYPLLLSKSIDRNLLWSKQIFVSEFWKRTLLHSNVAGFEFEKELTPRLLLLPVDQRYALKEMESVSAVLTNILS